MSVLGTYGVMSQLVATRQRDLAMRAALGATRSEVLRHVLFTNAKLALTGIACGSIAAWFAARSVETSFTGFDASASSPCIIAVLVLTVATQLSSGIPARRAAHADISQVLSSD
jgi:putative ABC transport system permease protein